MLESGDSVPGKCSISVDYFYQEEIKRSHLTLEVTKPFPEFSETLDMYYFQTSLIGLFCPLFPKSFDPT